MTAIACDTESCWAMPFRVSAQINSVLRGLGPRAPPRPWPRAPPPCPAAGAPDAPVGACAGGWAKTHRLHSTMAIEVAAKRGRSSDDVLIGSGFRVQGSGFKVQGSGLGSR